MPKVKVPAPGTRDFVWNPHGFGDFNAKITGENGGFIYVYISITVLKGKGLNCQFFIDFLWYGRFIFEIPSGWAISFFNSPGRASLQTLSLRFYLIITFQFIWWMILFEWFNGIISGGGILFLLWRKITWYHLWTAPKHYTIKRVIGGQ